MKDKNAIVLIVGDRGNIGLSISKELTDSGYKVVSCGNLDITNEEAVNDYLKKTNHKIEHLVYCVSSPLEFVELKNEDIGNFDKHFNVQVKGLFYLIKKLVRFDGLKSIQVIGSTCLFNRPPARSISYVTSKYALLGFVRSLVTELSPSDVRVNMISPGITGLGVTKNYPSKFIEMAKIQTPLKRLVTGNDIAKLVKFLISDDARYITGLNIPLDGGITVM